MEKLHTHGPTPIVPWIEAHVYNWITTPRFQGVYNFDLAELLKLVDYQKEILTHIWTPDENGDYPYSEVLWSQPKKNGKTQIAAAVGAWFSENVEPPNMIYTMASNQEQSAGLIFNALLPTLYGMGGSVPNTTLSVPLIVLPNGTTIRAIPNNYEGQAGGSYGLTLWSEPWTYKCLDIKTEVMTRAGFKFLKDLSSKDEYATENDAGILEWQKADAVNVYDYDGELIRFKHKRVDFLVTPNHRVKGRFITNERYKKAAFEQPWAYKTAEEASKFYMGWVKSSSSWIGEIPKVVIPAFSTAPEFEVTNLECWFTLMGYYIAEGSVGYYDWKDTHEPRECNIAQSLIKNGEKYKEIDLTARQLFPLQTRKDFQSVTIKNRAFAKYLTRFGKAAGKFIPEDIKNAPPALLSLFFYAYLKGDGHQIDNCWQAQTVSKRLADDLCEVAIKLGYVPRLMSIEDFPNDTRQRLYRLSFSLSNIAWQRENSHWSKEYYKGVVWCPTTKNGNIFIRRNGKCSWTGNSERDRRLWEEMPPVPTRKTSVRWAESYAGFQNESVLLIDMFSRVFGTTRADGTRNPDFTERQIQKKARPVPGLEHITAKSGRPSCWHIPEEGFFMFWDDRIRGPWITQKYIDQQKAGQRHSTYVRLWENKWQTSEGTFIEPNLWDDAITLDGEELGPMTLAGDASQRNDTTGLVGVEKRKVKIFGEEQERYRVRLVRVWDPEGRDIDLDDTIAAYVERIYKMGLLVGAFRYDPFQMHQVAVNLRKRGVPCVEFNQGQDRLKADTFLWKLFNDRRIDVYPNSVLEAHVKGANAKEYENEQVRIVKGTATEANKVDAAVALSMAVWAASGRVKRDVKRVRTSSQSIFKS